MWTTIYKNALILAIFAVISAGAVGVIHHLTKARIQNEKEQALYRVIHRLLPPSDYDNDLYHDCTLVTAPEWLGTQAPVRAFRARRQGQPVALLLQSVAPNGYNGAIELLVAISRDGVEGVEVLSHQETPGLGDQIESRKSHWLKQFKGKSLATTPLEQWKVKKDGGVFDALTGATITPRAVVQAVSKTLTYGQTHWSDLFSSPANCHGGTQ